MRADGTLLGDQFPLFTGSGTQWQPVIANDPVGSQYLVVFGDVTAGNVLGQRVSGAAPDASGPAWPPKARLTVTNVGTTAQDLAWPDATDDVDVAYYAVSRNGVFLTDVPGDQTTLAVTGLSPGVKYTYTIVARDDAGNTTTGPTAFKKTPRK